MASGGWNKGLKGKQVAWNKGKPWPEEIREKMSKARIGKIPWNKGLKGIQKPYTRTKESTKKFVESRRIGKGFIPSAEVRKKMSENSFWKGKVGFNKGRKFGSPSKETIRKRSLALKGHKGCIHSEETKRIIGDKARGRRAWNKGKCCPEETRRKIRENKKGKGIGENNPNWNGGSSFLPYPPIFNNDLKQFIRNRDNNECQNPYCEQKTERLDIHHIDYNKENCSQFNLITICRQCNAKSNSNREEWKRFYKKIIWGKYQ